MKNVSMIVELKKGRVWTATRTETDETEIYKSLSHDLIAKKIHGASYIVRIKDVCNYDGTRTITVTYNNDVRRVYTIEFH